MAIREWLDTFRTKSTKQVYRSAIRSFETVIEGNVDDYVAKVKSGHDPFDDLLKFATSLADRPPKTANTYMAAVRGFLEFSLDYSFTRKQMKLLRNKLPRGKRARTVEDDLTREKLRQILTHCDTKGRALFLLLQSSGIRVGEALKLELDDIDFTSDPPKVNVRGEYSKTGDPYYSFVSSEAKDALTEWIKVRNDYLRSSAKRGKGLAKKYNDGRGKKSIEDSRVFPYSSTVASLMWNRALKKAGLENHDKGTNRRTLHIHMLRKYFSSQMRLAVPRAIVEALMGHEEGLDDAYRRYTEAQIREWYRKGERYLNVFSSEEIRELQTKVRQFGEDYLEMRQTIRNLETQVKELGEAFAKNLSREVQKVIEGLYGEDLESMKDVEKAREEFTEKQRKEHKPPTKEEKSLTEEKTATSSYDNFYKQL